MNDEDPFEQFWLNSKFDKYTIRDFAAKQELYQSKEKVEAVLDYSHNPELLPEVKTKLTKIAVKRESGREFSGDELSQKDISEVLSSFMAIEGDLEHRVFASAGATNPLEIFYVNFQDQGFYYYNPDMHAVNKIGKALKWSKAKDQVNITVKGEPNLLILFVLFTDRILTKYDLRGGRFALIEVGEAVQQLGMTIANSKKLCGVACGGLIDDYWIELLDLDKKEAKLALGYLVGKK